MKKIVKLFIICLLIFNAFSVFALTVFASDPTPDASSDSNSAVILGQSVNTGSLNGFTQVAIVVSEFILGIVGSLALLAFVVGGMMWILSAGNAELVTRGKQTILGAVIGLVIVFTSFMIIRLVYSSLGLDWKGESSFPKATNLPVTPSS